MKAEGKINFKMRKASAQKMRNTHKIDREKVKDGTEVGGIVWAVIMKEIRAELCVGLWVG